MNRDHQWKRTTRIWKIFQFWWNEILPPRANHKQFSTRGEKKQKSENRVAERTKSGARKIREDACKRCQVGGWTSKILATSGTCRSKGTKRGSRREDSSQRGGKRASKGRDDDSTNRNRTSRLAAWAGRGRERVDMNNRSSRDVDLRD